MGREFNSGGPRHFRYVPPNATGSLSLLRRMDWFGMYQHSTRLPGRSHTLFRQRDASKGVLPRHPPRGTGREWPVPTFI